MATLSDPERKKAYEDALSNWSYHDYVEFELNESAYKYLREELGLTTTELKELMWEFVKSGGDVDEVRETRRPWCEDHEFHHDLRFDVGRKRVYVETRLHFSPPFKPDESTITIVNIHDP